MKTIVTILAAVALILFGILVWPPIFVLPMIVGLGYGYFFPSFRAYAVEHPAKEPILLVNLALGWTVVGYLVCLIWAYSEPEPAKD